MTQRKSLNLFVTWVLVLSLWSPAAGDSEPQMLPRKPKLVVLLVVDQMRADYLRMYGHQWKHGLRELMERGAWFPLAAYPYMNTVTCPGHATIATGSFPATHGMILNAWWDRGAGKSMSCTDDPQIKNISHSGSANKSGMSAWRLQVPTLADQLRAQSGGKSRVVTFSLKARSAIMMAGHGGDAVTWFDDTNGAWVTSDAFAKAPVPFIEKFAKENPVARDEGKVWSKLLPEVEYRFTDDAEGEFPPSAWGKTFPHALKSAGSVPDASFFTQWAQSPFSDEYLARFAMAAVSEWKLGHGPETDFLGVSFSALDLLGHDFGPASHEVQDLMARLDATIGRLLEFLDKNVGPANYVLALTADHGVAPLPEQMKPDGMSAGRIATPVVANAVEEEMKKHFGEGKYVSRMTYPDIYFEPGSYDKLKQNPAAMQAVEQKILSFAGIWRVFRSEELQAAKSGEDTAAQAAALSHYPGRSGDMVVLPKPNWFFVGSARIVERGGETTHGTSHAYDAHVPVILYGAGIQGGVYPVESSPADIAPTFAYMCGVSLPRPDGRVLSEALAKPPERPAAKPR